MTLAEIKANLKKTGYEVAYSHFDTPQKCPFITYLINGSNDIAADDENYQQVSALRIELYTNRKDIAAEKNIESILKRDGVMDFYSKTEIYIESEKVYQISYESEVIIE